MLGIFDVTNSIGGHLVDTAKTPAEAQDKIAVNGHVGYIYNVRFTAPPAMCGVNVGSFRVCGEVQA